MNIDDRNAISMERQRLGGDYYKSSTVTEKDALEDRHYDIDDLHDCFSSADLKCMDALARSGDFAELGRIWNSTTKAFRQRALEDVMAYLEEEANDPR